MGMSAPRRPAFLQRSGQATFSHEDGNTRYRGSRVTIVSAFIEEILLPTVAGIRMTSRPERTADRTAMAPSDGAERLKCRERSARMLLE